MKQTYNYDLEVYKNFFSASFKLLSKKKTEWREFIIFYDSENLGKSINNLDKLIDFINNEVECLIGYNSQSYDNPILNHLRQPKVIRAFKGLSPKDICQNIKDLSDAIIDSQNGSTSDYITNLRRSLNFRSLDLFLLFNTIQRKSLKQIAINLKHNIIQDLPYEISHTVKYHEIKTIMDYNKNDVIITEKLLYALSKEITDREEIYNREKLDVRNDNDVNIGKKILRKYYEQESGKKYDDYKDLRSWYKKISLNDCVSNKIKFKTKKYQDLLYQIRSKTIDPTRRKKKVKGEKSDFEFIVDSKEMTHTIAKGGIHSNNTPRIYEEKLKCDYCAGNLPPSPGGDKCTCSTDTHEYWDVDVKNCSVITW